MPLNSAAEGAIARLMGASNAPPAPTVSQTTDQNPIAQLLRDHPELATRLKKGGSASSVSKRADGIAQRGKTKGRMR